LLSGQDEDCVVSAQDEDLAAQKPMSPGGLENPPSVNPTQHEDISERGDGALHAVNFKALFWDGMTGYE
jgi:hypothetical protein